MPNELATQSKTALSVWSLESTQEKIHSLVPATLSWERFKRLSTSLIHRNPKIAECEPISLMSCFSDCAIIGVYPDPVTGLAYIIPRFNKKKQCLEATLLVGYKGLRSIALRSPDIIDMWTGVVRRGDVFTMKRAPRQELIHEPLPEESGEVIGCYSIAALRNGMTSYEWMPLSDLNKIKADALAGMEDWKREQSPWTVHENEMNRKTVLRRHFKSLPLRAEDQEAAAKEVDVELNPVDVRVMVEEKPKRPLPPPKSDKGIAAVLENAEKENPSTPPPTPEPAPEPAKAAELEVMPPATPAPFTPISQVPYKEIREFSGVKVIKCAPTPNGRDVSADVESADLKGEVYAVGGASAGIWKEGAFLELKIEGLKKKGTEIPINVVREAKVTDEVVF